MRARTHGLEPCLPWSLAPCVTGSPSAWLTTQGGLTAARIPRHSPRGGKGFLSVERHLSQRQPYAPSSQVLEPDGTSCLKDSVLIICAYYPFEIT